MCSVRVHPALPVSEERCKNKLAAFLAAMSHPGELSRVSFALSVRGNSTMEDIIFWYGFRRGSPVLWETSIAHTDGKTLFCMVIVSIVF